MLKNEIQNHPRPRRNFVWEAWRALVLFIFNLCGWHVIGQYPKDRKVVVIAAPHTSNWDAIAMLAAAMHFRVKLNWLGKDSLFKPPFGWFMRWMGGIPVDRSKANNMVAQIIAVYGEFDDIHVAIPPEGTRGKTKRWKTGFYHIADGANVPLVCAFVDFSSKTTGVSFVVNATGDYDKDMGPVIDFYDGITARYEEKKSL